MLQRNAQKGYNAMVKPDQVQKMQTVLEKIGLLKDYHQEISNFNKIDSFKKNEEHTFLDQFMEKVHEKANFKKALYEAAI
jgi:hypothetical protein